ARDPWRAKPCAPLFGSETSGLVTPFAVSPPPAISTSSATAGSRPPPPIPPTRSSQRNGTERPLRQGLGARRGRRLQHPTQQRPSRRTVLASLRAPRRPTPSLSS